MNCPLKHTIEVRRYLNGTTHHSMKPEYVVVSCVKRVLYTESIGNFNPVFCRYKDDPRVMVFSEDGDVSDPFRGTLTKLFIELKSQEA